MHLAIGKWNNKIVEKTVFKKVKLKKQPIDFFNDRLLQFSIIIVDKT